MLAGGLAGCSSVPDVTYADSDASADSAPAVEDAGTPGPTPTPPTEEGYRCPDRPPPAGEGICCGTRLCLRCNVLQCSTCEREACKPDQVCCARGVGLGGGNMSCSAATACK